MKKRADVIDHSDDNPNAEHPVVTNQNMVDENLDREMEVVNNLLSEGKLNPHNVADPRQITLMDGRYSS